MQQQKQRSPLVASIVVSSMAALPPSEMLSRRLLAARSRRVLPGFRRGGGVPRPQLNLQLTRKGLNTDKAQVDARHAPSRPVPEATAKFCSQGPPVRDTPHASHVHRHPA